MRHAEISTTYENLNSRLNLYSKRCSNSLIESVNTIFLSFLISNQNTTQCPQVRVQASTEEEYEIRALYGENGKKVHVRWKKQHNVCQLE